MFAVDVGVPLAEMLPFQLVFFMEKKGWQWRQWVPPKQRTSKMLPLEDAYVYGEALVRHSTLDPSQPYMACLLDAANLTERGLLHVPHGKIGK